MARQIGLLERARLEEEFDQAKAMAEKLRILHTLGMAIASAMDLEQVLTRIVEAAVFITEAEEGSLLLLDEETERSAPQGTEGTGRQVCPWLSHPGPGQPGRQRAPDGQAGADEGCRAGLSRSSPATW